VDHVTILDTGSTDDTVDTARRFLADTDVQYAVSQRPFDGFGPSRTALLELARQAPTDYTLMLDADHTLHIEGDQPDLDADEYMIRVRDDGGRLPLLTRTQHPF